MRILIDLQCAQSSLPTKGIKRYLIGLLDALLDEPATGEHELHVLLNGSIPKSIAGIQRRYADLHKAHRIHVFSGLIGSGNQQEDASWRTQASRLLRDFAIAGVASDVILCPSFFRIDRKQYAFSRLTLSDTPTVALHHDLVSTQRRQVETDSAPCPAHLARFKDDIQTCSALLAVSEAARRNASEILEYPDEHIHIAPGDADVQSAAPDNISLADMENLRTRYGLGRPYLLCDGDEGNLEGVVDAFSALPRGVIDSYDLVICAKHSQRHKAHLEQLFEKLSGTPVQIRILEPLTDSDLAQLYALAALFIMTDTQAGSALPALEAVRCGTLTLGANTTSILDTIGTPETVYDPTDIPGTADLIHRSLTDDAFCTEMQRLQMQHASRFSWKSSAQKVLSLLKKYGRASDVPSGWAAVQTHIDALEIQAISALKKLKTPENGLSIQSQNDLARALSKTRLAIEAAWRPGALPQANFAWRLEGPFDSDYSLASVNRETACALKKRGIDVALFSAEGDGPFDPDPDYLSALPELLKLHRAGQSTSPETVHVLSRNMFPPRVSDMRGSLNLLHGFAWEETGFPQSFTRDMTSHLQGLLVTSSHVKKLFEDVGIGVPVHVVGNGVDHLDVPPAAVPMELVQAEFVCLHVSSCFPRKGADVLLAGFADAFTTADDVHLVIKTFANPHNDIKEQVSALRATHPNLPPITVIDDPLTPAQMRGLYAAADLLIAPSRAEGYCLPVAEALLAGTPVLTTGWSGQKVFSDNPLVHFIDYRYTPAKSHLGAWNSVWAEPDHADLVRKLRTLRRAPKPGPEIRAESYKQVLTKHSWSKVAERSEEAARRIASVAPKPPPTVGWVSSFNTRCGIATYSAHLIKAFPDKVTVFASHTDERIEPDSIRTRRCWRQDGLDTLTELQSEIDTSDPQVLVIQFNYGFFSLPHLSALILQAKADGRHVVVMLHATDDSAVPTERHLGHIRPALAACDRLLVHSHHDLNHLKSLGLEDNVALFPHGVPHAHVPAPPEMTPDRPVVLGTYGFFLPPKGLNQLIEAVALVREHGENVALQMVNAEFPIKDSADAIAVARQQITALELDDHVTLETNFLKDSDSFARLARSDALVFSYRKTAESASGAIRQALAIDRPVLATPIQIFDDVEPLVLRLPGTTPEAMAEGLLPVVRALRNPRSEPEVAANLEMVRLNAGRWRDSHAYEVLAPRLWRQICALFS